MALHINFLMKNHILSLLRHIPLETPASVRLLRPIVPRIPSLIHFYRAKNVLLHHAQVRHRVPDAVVGSCVVFVEGKYADDGFVVDVSDVLHTHVVGVSF